ncbi:uncharacterized protein A1O9_03461 [Exophiala aquamarina CBS 119918]|uniref:tRNA(Phe) 7-[(3-amino-3-carboxypropyl)-4-demethylwyosine(37)-N(4)]-methyltransferase n=1 Tax=Exophiala aquamarina CBS 119918 TaxID=1182545 RepID=A0A072PP68_9EURO|nr:uncharacterized protein A1O9_03461 [Exophiala aquamarina CBS 119918]KEF61889.1 hypothetical protein A1O9_03461 [Exophiala aquamarina CBS 119918]
MARPQRDPAPKSSSSPSIEIPAAFTARKQKILSELQQPADEYTDKSPKGNVDAGIRDLIDEINGIEGYVTTSSCAGRVAVFVEGGDAGDGSGRGEANVKDESTLELEAGLDKDTRSEKRTAASSMRTSPGGKGGGHWLYVSHDSIPVSSCRKTHGSHQSDHFTKLFQLASPIVADLQQTPSQSNGSDPARTKMPRLVHLLFSPLILHIHCASLGHARPLLSAAINAGFRESGVQSLRVLGDQNSGVMVAIRTAGLAFETVVGVVENVEGQAQDQEVRRIVSEDYLAMCATVVNERFKWNDVRRERLRAETRRFIGRQQGEMREDEDERRLRKRREGLLRQRQTKMDSESAKKIESKNLWDRDQDGSLHGGLTSLDLGCAVNLEEEKLHQL